ncbi:hypothetical protein E3Q24_02962 [Wallemia mellicola]|nr:hypothetical protein E3Q24_02962 [Wallemia mellicola]
MKGLIITGTRKAEVLEIEKPVLTGHNNVLVENPPDSFSLYGSPGKPGNLLGSDFAGVVVESKSDKIKVGDRVCGMVSGNHSASQGTFAEYVAINVDMCIKIPDEMTFTNASTLGMSLYTAVQALFLKSPFALDPSHTQNILIWGASTAVGMYAVQLARKSGVNVVATTSSKNSDLVKSLGANLLFDYADVDVVDKIKQATNDNVTFALDCVGYPDSLHKSVISVSDTKPAIVHTLLPPQKDFPLNKTNAQVKFSLIHSVFAEDLSWANYIFNPPITQTEMDEEQEKAAKFFNYDKGALYEPISNNEIKTTPIFATSRGLDNILPWLLKMERGEIRGGKVVHVLKD